VHRLVVTGADRIGTVEGGVQGRAVQAVVGRTWNGGRQASGQGGIARHVAVFFTGAVGITKDDVVDGIAIQVRVALDKFCDEGCGEIIRANTGESTAEPTKGSA